MGGFAIYEKKLFAIAELCEFKVSRMLRSQSKTLKIDLINLHLRFGFINKQIQTDSSSTGILNRLKKALTRD